MATFNSFLLHNFRILDFWRTISVNLENAWLCINAQNATGQLSCLSDLPIAMPMLLLWPYRIHFSAVCHPWYWSNNRCFLCHCFYKSSTIGSSRLDPQRDHYTFDRSHLQNAWTNVHIFQQTIITQFISEHVCHLVWPGCLTSSSAMAETARRRSYFHSQNCEVAFLSHPLGHFFTNSYCWDVTGENLSTWASFEGGWGAWVTSIAHFRRKGTSPTNHCWVAEN